MTDAHKAAVEIDNDRELSPAEAYARTVAFVVHDGSRGHPIARLNDALDAYLAAMAVEGWVIVRDVTITATSDTPPEFVVGWNACRAAMLGDSAGASGDAP